MLVRCTLALPLILAMTYCEEPEDPNEFVAPVEIVGTWFGPCSLNDGLMRVRFEQGAEPRTQIDLFLELEGYEPMRATAGARRSESAGRIEWSSSFWWESIEFQFLQYRVEMRGSLDLGTRVNTGTIKLSTWYTGPYPGGGKARAGTFSLAQEVRVRLDPPGGR